jgi:hypothetical protein
LGETSRTRAGCGAAVRCPEFGFEAGPESGYKAAIVRIGGLGQWGGSITIVAVVTGAASGMGRASAIGLAKHGAKVVVAAE